MSTVQAFSLQRNQLEELMQSMSRSRDENLVADIESSVRMAQQQAELSKQASSFAETFKQDASGDDPYLPYKAVVDLKKPEKFMEELAAHGYRLPADPEADGAGRTAFDLLTQMVGEPDFPGRLEAADVLGYEGNAAENLQQVAQASVPLEGAENARILAWRPSDGCNR